MSPQMLHEYCESMESILMVMMITFSCMGVLIIVVPVGMLIYSLCTKGKRKEKEHKKAIEAAKRRPVWYQCDCYACTYRKHYWRVGKHTDAITIGTGMPPQCLGVNRNNYYR